MRDLACSSLLVQPLTRSIDRLITEWRIQRRVEDQFKAFLSGFNELIPQELINVFDERELEVRPLPPSVLTGRLKLELMPNQPPVYSCSSAACPRLTSTIG